MRDGLKINEVSLDTQQTGTNSTDASDLKTTETK
jgi:hypothetical protein